MTATSAPARGGLESARDGLPAARRGWRLPFSPWHLVLLPATLVLIFPFAWLLITSVETTGEALHFPPVLIPHVLRFANYPDALATAPFGRFFLNSAIVAVVTVAANLVLCSLAGYAFARFRFLGRTALFIVIMATLMVPFQVTMIPQFIITKWLGVHVLAEVGINHIGALILPNAATAFGIFFLRQFFRTLPLEYEESARVDGASRLKVLWRIVLPLATPALATLAALTFLDSWNNFLWPLIAVTSTSQMTLPLGLATFQGAHQTEWTLVMAANVMSLIPMLVIFFAAQRYFIRSVAATGLAGT
ncbi:MAG TPA: carbohydrate ABC transporter permease [Streptosporangiaceae bacterium]|jgi:multiple sugar transport system permease protein|nr:carbohydrate ABC transporter permease [Streptosporangiaceae bacterium]